MPKILAYMTLPDNKIDQLKKLIKKTHGNPKWMEEHAKRTGINSIDTFFAKLPTGTAMIVVRDPAESLENRMKSELAGSIWGKDASANLRLLVDNQVLEALKHFNEADAFVKSIN